MNIADLDALVKSLQDPDLREALAHPDWKVAYEALCDVQGDRIEDFWELCDEAQFITILNKMEFSVVSGVLMSDEYAWRNGEWDYCAEADPDSE